MEKPQLTFEAQAAIQNYLWTLLGPVAFLVAIVAGVTGYFIKDIATTKADLQGAQELQKRLGILDDEVDKSVDEWSAKLLAFAEKSAAAQAFATNALGNV